MGSPTSSTSSGCFYVSISSPSKLLCHPTSAQLHHPVSKWPSIPLSQTTAIPSAFHSSRPTLHQQTPKPLLSVLITPQHLPTPPPVHLPTPNVPAAPPLPCPAHKTQNHLSHCLEDREEVSPQHTIRITPKHEHTTTSPPVVLAPSLSATRMICWQLAHTTTL